MPKQRKSPKSKPMPAESVQKASSEASALGDAAHWHQRQQDGRYGALAAYGGSEDQWADERPMSVGRAGKVSSGARGGESRAPRSHFDSEPYRQERMYGQAQAGSDEERGDGYAPSRGGWSLGRRTLPKGYQRSDERILEDICERLARAHMLDVSDVSVEVAEGLVTLQGSVPVRGMKHAIEDIADDCVGVLDVENRIKVLRRTGPGNDGTGLARPEDDGVLLNGRQT